MSRELPKRVDPLEEDIEIHNNQKLSAQSKTPEPPIRTPDPSILLQPSHSVQTSSPRIWEEVIALKKFQQSQLGLYVNVKLCESCFVGLSDQ
jgi:hypothetical protein